MRKVNPVAIAVPLVTFVVYLFTLYPTVGWVDCGEIAAGCYMLNVLHPTGYPLFTLIGYLFAHLPIGSVVTRINAMSALFSAFAALFCYLSVLRLTRWEPAPTSQVAGTVTAALYAFSYTVWSNSVDADVFALTAFLVSLTIFMLVRFRDRRGELAHLLPFVAYLLGLALTNHMSFMSTFAGAGVFLLLMGTPRCVVSPFSGRDTTLRSVPIFRPRILLPILFFLLGLTPYVLLLVRSQAQPLLNWGNAHNLERLVWHVTGKQYQVWMFSLPFSDALRNLGKALTMLGQELYIVLIPVFLLGAWTLRKKQIEVFWLLTIIFVLNIFYAINYSIPDIQSYYIPFMIAAFIFTGVGLAEVIRRLKRVPQYALLVLVAVPMIVNYRRAGGQGNYIAEDFGRNYLKSAPPNAIVLTTNWDIYSPVFYLRQVEGLRPDVCIIDKELLRRSWYFQNLDKEYPWLIERSKPEIDRYRYFLDQFEHNTLRDVKGIQDAFIAMINSFITRNPERRAFLTFNERTDNDVKSLVPERLRIPYGLYYELRSDAETDTFDYRQFVLRRAHTQLDERTRVNLQSYERLAGERAVLLAKLGRRAEAQAVREWLEATFPDSDLARRLQSQ